MLSKVRTALHQAVEEMVKEFDSSYEETKLNNEALKNNNRFLAGRIKDLHDRCTALEAEKDCSAIQEENARLLGLTAQQKEENEVLHRKVNDLLHKLCQAYQKRDELAEKLKNKAILDSVCAQKYEKQQIALNSDIGEAFECELDGRPFEKGYYVRISKEAYDLSKDARIYAHVTLMKRSDK